MPNNATLQLTYRIARRIAVALVGGSVVLVGIIMLVTPGPAIVVVPIGLAILGLEFAWARRWLQTVRQRISRKNADSRAAKAEQYRP